MILIAKQLNKINQNISLGLILIIILLIVPFMAVNSF